MSDPWIKDEKAIEMAARSPPSTHFPPEVAQALQAAVLTPIPRLDPLARVRAIEKATERARAKYPEFFRKED